MSNPRRPGEDEIEDLAVLEALTFLEGAEELRENSLSEEAAAVLEAVALLPYVLEPIAPAPPTREALLEKVAGGPSPRRHDRPHGAIRTFRAPEASHSAPIPVWARALVAGLVLAVVGLTFSTLRLSRAVEHQGEEIASLTHSLEVGHREAEARNAAVLTLPSDPRLQPIPANGSRLFPLTTGSASRVHGAVFVCGEHRRWFLRLSGLEPVTSDRSYRLWFVTPSGAIPVTRLEPQAGQPLEVSADRMPPETVGIYISLESPSSALQSPDRKQVIVEGREILKV
ncbi:MAG: anti-sigma factor [Acidobacteria bacterium]|nr:anti-sigma factor [Acidobacteriota bacterium]